MARYVTESKLENIRDLITNVVRFKVKKQESIHSYIHIKIAI
jgi:hypothetical protein